MGIYADRHHESIHLVFLDSQVVTCCQWAFGSLYPGCSSSPRRPSAQTDQSQSEVSTLNYPVQSNPVDGCRSWRMSTDKRRNCIRWRKSLLVLTSRISLRPWSGTKVNVTIPSMPTQQP